MHLGMNKFLLPIRLAFDTFKKAKARSSLTVFGVMIGIAMVIIVLSSGNGVKSLILDEVSSFGDNWINIEIKIPSASKTSQENSSGIARGVQITTLNHGDLEALIDLPNIETGYAGITTQSAITFGAEQLRASVFGVSATYDDISDMQMDQGRFYTEDEDRSAAQVVVLGNKVAKNLFGNADPVGKIAKIDGKGYRVVGVSEELGATGFIDMDEIIYIPTKTVQKKIMGIDHVLWIVVQTIDNTKAESTAEEIRFVMRERHDITNPDKDDFSVTTMNEALSIIETILLGITGLLIVLSMISLLVGGVGIMNVMYVSVAERTFEIGLRKSVGASENEILKQFLVEAVVITMLGGVTGIIAGFMISYLISVGAQYAGLKWDFTISVLSILLGVSFSALVGVFFGLYPAKKAARLDPIAALRQE